MPRNVIIVGMARSGTSLTAGIFARCGYTVGRIASTRMREGDDSNPFGYFEADDLVEANVGVLGRAGYPHHNTWRYEPIDDRTVAAIAGVEPTPEDRRLVETYDAGSPWLWKDPRLSFTLRFWWPLMDPQNTAVLLVSREPAEIYGSFRRRGWCPASDAARREVALLAQQHLDAARATIDALSIPHVVVEYGEYRDRPAEVARRLGEFFGLQLTATDLNVRAELDHSTLRGRLTTLLRVQLLKIPKRTRTRLRRIMPRRLVALVFPEWKHVRRDSS